MDENKRKHLEFLQNVIGRMNENSRHIKTWCITLLVALGAIFSTHHSVVILFVALFEVIVFWFLDAYYLCEERKFKLLYHDVTRKRESEIDFSMREWRYKSSYLKALISKAELLFYLPLSLLLLALIVVLVQRLN